MYYMQHWASLPSALGQPCGRYTYLPPPGQYYNNMWNFSNTLDWNRQKVVITHDPCRMAHSKVSPIKLH